MIARWTVRYLVTLLALAVTTWVTGPTAAALTPDGAAKLAKGRAALDSITVNSKWERGEYEASDGPAVADHHAQIGGKLTEATQAFRTLRGGDRSSPEAHAYVKRLNRMVKYSNTLVSILRATGGSGGSPPSRGGSTSPPSGNTDSNTASGSASPQGAPSIRWLQNEFFSLSTRSRCPIGRPKLEARVKNLWAAINAYEGPGKDGLKRQIKTQLIDEYERVKQPPEGYSWDQFAALGKTLESKRKAWPPTPKDRTDLNAVKTFLEGTADLLQTAAHAQRLYKATYRNPCAKKLGPQTLTALKRWRVFSIRQKADARIARFGGYPDIYMDKGFRRLYKSLRQPLEDDDIGGRNQRVTDIATFAKTIIDSEALFATYPLWARYFTKDHAAPKGPSPPSDPSIAVWNAKGASRWSKASILASMPDRMKVRLAYLRKIFDVHAAKLVNPPAVKNAKARKLARKLGGKRAFATTSVERKTVQRQEDVRRVSDTKKLVRRWTEVFDVFEMMWNGKAKKQPWPHMRSKLRFCPTFRAIGIKYKKGHRVKKGVWQRKEDDHVGFVVCS